tara:strand:- start:531 stop:725 length:195 start_codon:yes stop_codon:yes gene_type:complete
MKVDLTNYSDDVAAIMKRYAEAQQDLHASTVNELNALIMQAHFAGIDKGAQEAVDCFLKKKEVA